ncbi:DUF3168 domain-containing protein [Martelella alba]|uniref:DUF3168 domain-containing protein n=1 Tax=Martelella alba TaxID=2590451 RepID=A0A506U8L7_9HYPH|nr:DUF3168 domain-containing protein [Martelella alba]TPW29444.1 DUF3168 domain-containing protein [Martelella alba]
MSARNVLQTAIHAVLSADATLTALIAEDGIVDRRLPTQRLPVIVYGAVDARNLTADIERTEEHKLTFEIWSDAPGRREIEQIVDRLSLLLGDVSLSLDGYVLINLQRSGVTVRRQARSGYFYAEVRFRAVTETA